MALLHVLLSLRSEYQLAISVAHFNHQMRGQDSDRDAQFVAALSADLSLPYHEGTAAVKEFARTNALSLEEAGRILRYRFLRNAASTLGASRIALGHTRNDQAETVLLRLLRGAGAAGLCGIRPVLDMENGLTAIRPLLNCERSEVVEFLRARSIAYVEDSSNQDLCFDRNRIRTQLIPYLEREFNPHIRLALARVASLVQEEEAWMAEAAGAEAARLLQPQADGVSLSVISLMARPLAVQRRILRQAIASLKGNLRRIAFAHVEALRNLCTGHRSGKQVDLPNGLFAQREFDRLILRYKARLPAPTFACRLPVPGELVIPEVAHRITAEVGNYFDLAKTLLSQRGVSTALFDANALGEVLTIRNRRPGDCCRLKQGHRKLKDVLIAKKIPRTRRDFLPLLTRPVGSGAVREDSPGILVEEVVWIPGCFLSPAVAATAASDACVRITAIPLKDREQA